VLVVKRSWVVLIAFSLLAAVLVATPANAMDTNGAAPQVKLTAAGQEGILGPGKTTLAYFHTEAPDPSWEYAPDSKVDFACTIDGASTPCAGTYYGCCRGTPEVVPFRPFLRQDADARSAGLGIYTGSVPLPAHLADGTHTITVTATDEDGTGPPATVTAIYDTMPPSAPELTEMPPRVSHIRKPIFRFAATDDVRLLTKRGEPFVAGLRRLDPPGQHYRQNGSGSYMSTWGPFCPTLLACSARSQAVYEAFERSLSFGVPERLVAGLYEFRVGAHDAVGNKSALTTYRFRVAPGKRRTGKQMIRK
jgi:hypothetical protein